LRYPIKFIVPLGFFMLCLQGLSEIIKRIALLQGNALDAPDVAAYEKPKQ
jgi:TRAP-type mannitol/chloroaromatic compound transport system permease small subunit